MIGRRRLDTHFLALAEPGRRVESTGATAEHAAASAAPIFLDEASVTATENVVMAAVLAEGDDDHPQRRMRAARPGSVPLAVTMGARIEGIGSNMLAIAGRARLGGGESRIGADLMEVGCFIGLAAVDRRRADDQGRRPSSICG